MKALSRVYTVLEKAFPGMIFCSIFIIMIMEIASRLIFQKSFEWNTEYCRYALVWITFIGSVYVRRENSHIRVLALYDWLGARGHVKTAFAMDVFSSLVSILFYLFIAVYGHKLSVVTARFSSSAMGLSQYWLYIATAAAGVLGALLELGTLCILAKAGFKGDYAGGSAKAVTMKSGEQ